jgi:DNA-binding NtrC family response regulator
LENHLEPSSAPISESNLPEQAFVQDASPVEGAPGRGEKILLVEDEEFVARFTMRALVRNGYHVVLARSPHEALRILEDDKPELQLLLTDVVMPGMDGKRLADEVLRRMPKLKVLFMSGYPREIIAQHGVIQSDIHFIEKPFTSRKLADKVRSVLYPV